VQPRHTLAAAATLAAILLPAVPAAAQDPQPPPWLKVDNGVSQPQFDFTQAIEEIVYVESEVDSDRDGRLDRVRIRISRPRETETQGYDVPVVFEHSPYRGNTGGLPNHPVDFEYMPQENLEGRAAQLARARSAKRARTARATPDLPGSLDNYYVPRGYAVVLGESIGTFNSDGCPDVGGRVETLGTKAVIDWLNGRARGWDASGEPVTADWTTGHTGMVGVSYNGTLPNQVATTGVEGLETIVPISAISSWYDYYRANGLVSAPHSNVHGRGNNAFQGEDTDVLAAYIGGEERMSGRCAFMMDYLQAEQDRVTGDWSEFWQERDYLSRVDRVRASVFVVHGLNDWNVNTKEYAEWWYRLADRGVPRKIWLHNGGHGGAGGAGAAPYKRAENRWFDRWLFGVQNGILQEPRATVQREDGSYHEEADWPTPGSRHARLHLSAPNATAPGTLSTRRHRTDRDVTQRFEDRGRELDTDEVLIQNPDTAHPNRLVFRSPELGRDVRMSGTPWVTLRMSIDNRTAANLTAVLVDYGPAGSSQAPVMVTRGWMDPQNREELDSSERVKRGQLYRFRWDLQPDDYLFKAGHRIGLVVVSTDHDYTIRPAPGTRLTLDPDDSRISLPVVGGRWAFGF
jgi:X-Pro dipeptidyl-peptidase